MNVEGTLTVPLARDVLWKQLADPVRLAGALTGVEARATADDDTILVTVRPVAGLGAAPLTVRLRLADRVPNERLVVRGHGVGTEYAVDLTATLRLTGDGTESTIDWSVDVGFCGVVASAGQRVLAQLVRVQLDDAATRIAEEVSRDPIG